MSHQIKKADPHLLQEERTHLYINNLKQGRPENPR